jgi:hypothetical protein
MCVVRFADLPECIIRIVAGMHCVFMKSTLLIGFYQMKTIERALIANLSCVTFDPSWARENSFIRRES